MGIEKGRTSQRRDVRPLIVLGIQFVGEFGARTACGLRLLLTCGDDFERANPLRFDLCCPLAGLLCEMLRAERAESDEHGATDAAITGMLTCRERRRIGRSVRSF